MEEIINVGGSLVGVIVGGAITYYVQSRRERVLMHQKWLDSLRERIPEVIGTAAWLYVSEMKKNPASRSSDEALESLEETKKIVELDLKITQVTLMLDLSKESHAELKQRMEDLRMAAFPGNGRIIEFPNEANRLKEACIAVLK